MITQVFKKHLYNTLVFNTFSQTMLNAHIHERISTKLSWKLDFKGDRYDTRQKTRLLLSIQAVSSKLGKSGVNLNISNSTGCFTRDLTSRKELIWGIRKLKS
jgi:hypothetical protein